MYTSGAQPFYWNGKIFEQKSPAGKKRAVKHHAGQKRVWFTPILSHNSLVIQWVWLQIEYHGHWEKPWRAKKCPRALGWAPLVYTKVSYKKYSLFERNNQYKEGCNIKISKYREFIRLVCFKGRKPIDFFWVELFQIYKCPLPTWFITLH